MEQTRQRILKSVKRGEVGIQIKIILALVFVAIVSIGIYQYFTSMFNKQNAIELKQNITSINAEGSKNISRGEIVGLNTYEDRLKGLQVGTASLKDVMVTYNGRSLFSGTNYTGADMIGYWDEVYNPLQSVNNTILNISYDRDGDSGAGAINIPVLLGTMPLAGNEDEKLSGFNGDHYYFIFNKDSTIARQLVEDNPSSFKLIEGQKIYDNSGNFATDVIVVEALDMSF